jgi:type II secretory pathway component PulF
MNMKSKELISFCNVLTTALKSGRALPETLLGLNPSSAEAKAVAWCKSLGKHLSEGYSLEEAVKKLSCFDPVLARIMPLLGENRLIHVLETYTRYLVGVESLNQKISVAIFYPFIVLILIVLNLFYLNLHLFPAASVDLTEAGRAPSLLMKLLFFADYSLWPMSLVIPTLLLFILFLFVRQFMYGFGAGPTLLGKLTGFNAILTRQNAARGQAVISLYLQAGFGLQKAVGMASEIFDLQFDSGLRDTQQALERGMDVSTAFALSPVLKDVCILNDTQEELTGVLSRFSYGNYRISFSLLDSISNVSGTVALFLAGFFVLCATSGMFDTYYWLIWSY